MKILRVNKKKALEDLIRHPMDGKIFGVGIKEFIPYCPVDLIEPNPWNPNEQDDFQFSKTVESLKTNGFVHNLVVCELWVDGEFKCFRLLDGEHRKRAAQEIGIRTAPVNNLGELPDTKARKLALILAANRGELNPVKLAKMLKDLEADLPREEFLQVPFSEEDLEKMKQYYDVSWKDIDIKDIFSKQKQIRAEDKKAGSDMSRMAFLVPSIRKTVLDAAFERYAAENNLSGDTNVQRGKVIMHLLFTVAYPDIKVDNTGGQDA